MAIKYDDLQNFRDPKSVELKETLEEQFAAWEAEIDKTLIEKWRTVAYNNAPYLTITYNKKTLELVHMVIEAYSKTGWDVQRLTSDESSNDYLTFKKSLKHSELKGSYDGSSYGYKD